MTHPFTSGGREIARVTGWCDTVFVLRAAAKV